MVLGFVVVDFVYGDGDVDDGGLDRFLLDNGLDGFVDVWELSVGLSGEWKICRDLLW